MKSPKHSISTFGEKADADAIIAFLQGEDGNDHDEQKLSKEVQERLNRVTATHALFMQYKLRSKVVKMHQKTFGKSAVTAYRDIHLMEKIYGNLITSSKTLKKQIAEEMIMQDREMALTKADTRSLASITKNYIMLHQLDKDEAEAIDASHFEGHPVVFAIIPEQVGANPRPIEELDKEFEKYVSATIDVEHEEVDG